MIGSLAQGALLMGVVYWYSKCMFSMINDYYRVEFKKNVIQKSQSETENYFQETETTKTKNEFEKNEINIKKLSPTTPTIEGLPDILKENSIVQHDDKIILRGFKDSTLNNCKLILDNQEKNCQEKESLIPNDDDKSNNIKNNENIIKKIDINNTSNLNSNTTNKKLVIEKNLCPENFQTTEGLLNFQQFNNNDQHHLNLHSISSTSTQVENEKITKIKNKFYSEYDDADDADDDDKVKNKNNNQNDDIVTTVDFNVPPLNPSTSMKLNYVSNRNPYSSIQSSTNDANNWINRKKIQCDDGAESLDTKFNHKFPINQLQHDKNKCNNMNIGICKINNNNLKPPKHNYNKNKDVLNGNYFTSDKNMKRKLSRNMINDDFSQKKSINSHSINNNQDNLKEIINSKSYNNINTFSQTNRDNEIKYCRRKSVSEYIEFWSNMQS